MPLAGRLVRQVAEYNGRPTRNLQSPSEARTFVFRKERLYGGLANYIDCQGLSILSHAPTIERYNDASERRHDYVLTKSTNPLH
jgi:hypothetical protein